jgi:hypothetical protein
LARTLFIVENDVWNDLPSPVKDGAVREVKRLFAFVPHFAVSFLRATSFPRIDFTDAIVKIVESDDEVGAALDHAINVELSNVVFSAQAKAAAKGHPVNLTRPALNRSSFNPDRGGVGSEMKKIVDAGVLRIGIAVTAGIASLETAKTAVVEFATGGDTVADIERREEQQIKKKGLGFFGTHGALTDARLELTWDLLKKGWSQWPDDLRDDVGVALGRLIAHETRHQYVGGDHANVGLGSDQAVLFGQSAFENFADDDRTDVLGNISRLQNEQNRANVLADTLPAGQAFPFD